MDNNLISILWVLTCASLVFLMQAGFACLECGLTRSKNNINVAVKNLTDFSLSILLFWAFGSAIMFGASESGWFGTTGFSLSLEQTSGSNAAFFLFQAMFCATAVTILSGAVAERMRFGGYLLMAVVISGLIYPLFGHWAWGGLFEGTASGWLGIRGFVDFAGSTVVHSVGGWASLAAILIIGARHGRFGSEQRVKQFAGSNIPLSILGVILLWIGWFGFNGGSTLRMDHSVPLIIVNTLLAGTASALTALAMGWWIYRCAHVGMLINGSLAGLVAITANCHAVSPTAAIIIGSVASLVMIATLRLLERWRIDDAIGAIPVHLGPGIWGTLAVALFCNLETLGTGLNRWEQLQVQAQGVFACFLVAFGGSYLFFRLINRYYPLRISAEDERVGLNVSEHGATTDLVDLLMTMDKHSKSGDLLERVNVDPFTEVGQISKHYNHVLDSQQSLMQELKNHKTAIDEHSIVAVTDHQGQIIYVNDKFCQISHYSRDELLGQNHRIINSGYHPTEFFQELWETIASGKVWTGKIQNKAKNGRFYWEQTTIIPFKDEQEKIVKYMAIRTDITAVKQIEADLLRGKQETEEMNEQLIKASFHAKELATQADQANVAKSDFLANMSHEIRTPMNAIIGFSDILVEEDLSDDQRSYVDMIHQSGKKLLNIINDILDFSKIEAGKLDVEMIDFELKPLLDYLGTLMSIKAQEKGLMFTIQHKTALPVCIKTDRMRLEQCLINLIDNAIKFTETGSVNMHVSQQHNEDKTYIRFDIVDTGIGISADKQQAIFESFSQADGSTTRKFGGTGLGLTISKQLVELLGGSVSVQSEPGTGSVFSICIPTGVDVTSQTPLDEEGAKDDTQPSSKEGEKNYSGDILVAEDNPTNQKLIEVILIKMGIDVTMVADGKQAVDRATEKSFDMILMDMQMPMMNGYEATKYLRKMGVTTPIIALTANAMKGDEQICLDAGCDRYLTKPVDRKKLSQVLDKYLPSVSSVDSQEEDSLVPKKDSQTDRSPIISDLADDPDYCEVAKVFVEDLPLRVQSLAEAVEQTNLDQLKILIHTLKGSGGSAGFPMIMDKAAEAEELLLNGELDLLKISIDELSQLCQRATAVKKHS